MALAARGRPKGSDDKPWRDSLRLAAFRLLKEHGDRRALDVIAEKTVALALEGDVQAMREIGDRLDGKPAQQQIVSGDDNAPVRHVFAWLAQQATITSTSIAIEHKDEEKQDA